MSATINDLRTNKPIYHRHPDGSLHPVFILGWNERSERVFGCYDWRDIPDHAKSLERADLVEEARRG